MEEGCTVVMLYGCSSLCSLATLSLLACPPEVYTDPLLFSGEQKKKKNMTRSVVDPLDTRCDIPSCHWSICIDMGTSSPATENKASLSVKFTSSVTEV